jgi:hypothetical protein
MNQIRMNWKYAKYIIHHKAFVFRAGLVLKVPIWRLLIHDWSKLLPCEWFPYAENFYGTRKTREALEAQAKYGCAELAPWGEFVEDRFNAAWLHHIHWNKHHWNYWVLVQEDGGPIAIPMPDKYIREMVADWFGAGKAITGSWEAQEWYDKHKDKMILHPETRKELEVRLAIGEYLLFKKYVVNPEQK